MATYALLDTYTVGSGGTSSVTFSNINAGYTDLVLMASVRTNRSSGNDYLKVSFNGTTTLSRYITFEMNMNPTYGQYPSSFTSPAQFIGEVEGNSGSTSNSFASVRMYITNYNGTALDKSAIIDSVAENNATGTNSAFINQTSMSWSGDSAITSLTFTPGVGSNFVQYSTFEIYGVSKDTTSTGTPSAPTINSVVPTTEGALIYFTPAGGSNVAESYKVTSTPGSITAIGNSSPLAISGLTAGTSYTFKIQGINFAGSGSQSSSSSSVTALDSSYEPIATIQANNTSTVTFTSIPQTYKHLQIRFNFSFSGNPMVWQGKSNNESGSNYYYGGSIAGNTFTTGTGAGLGNADTYLGLGYPQDQSGWSNIVGYIDVPNYTQTNKYRNFGVAHFSDNNATANVNLRTQGMMRASTSAITQLELTASYPSYGSQQYQTQNYMLATFTLYGIKG